MILMLNQTEPVPATHYFTFLQDVHMIHYANHLSVILVSGLQQWFYIGVLNNRLFSFLTTS